MANRTIVTGGIWAEDATNPPTTTLPVPLVTYRQSNLTEPDIKAAWPYSQVVDSAKHNEMLYRLSTLMKSLEDRGVLPWCQLTPYGIGALAGGTDNLIYVCIDTSLGDDPVSSPTKWAVTPLQYQVGVKAGNIPTVNQPVTATTRATTTTLGTTLNHTLSDSNVAITGFVGEEGVTYHCRVLGGGTIVFHATNLIITQSSTDIETETNDTFDVEMITPTTCRVKNYIRASESLDPPYIDSISSLRVNHTPINNQIVQVKSHTTIGDGGGGNFRGVTGAPIGTYVDDNGLTIVPTGGDGSAAFIRMFSGVVHVAWFGAKGDGSDDSAAINAAHAASSSVEYGPYHKVLRQINVPHNSTIIAHNTVLDGNDAAFDTTFGDATLSVGNLNARAVSDLSWSPNQAQDNIVFNADHGLQKGEVFFLIDSVDYSWSSARAEYRKGEMCEVSQVVSTTNVLLAAPLYDSYSLTTVNVYEPEMGTFSLVGNLEVISTKPGTSVTYAVQLNQIRNSTITGLHARALNGSYTALSLRNCYKVSIDYTAEQELLSGFGGDYGIALSNCQSITTNGFAKSSRHAITHGGFSGGVVTRDCHNTGVWETDGTGQVPAADVHGNCENISFKGTARGGVNAGGKTVKFDGVITDSYRGICIYFTEVKAFDFDFSGCTLIAYVDPNLISRGVVDFGGSSTSEVNNMESGTLDFSRLVVKAPTANKVINILLRNALSTGTYNINFRDSKITAAAAGVPFRVSASISGHTFDTVDMRGVQATNKAGSSIISVDNLWLWEQKGIADIVYTTAIGDVLVSVIYTDPYPAGYTPIIKAALQDSTAVGAYLGLEVGAISINGFNIRVATYNGTNFTANRTDQVVWEAG